MGEQITQYHVIERAVITGIKETLQGSSLDIALRSCNLALDKFGAPEPVREVPPIINAVGMAARHAYKYYIGDEKEAVGSAITFAEEYPTGVQSNMSNYSGVVANANHAAKIEEEESGFRPIWVNGAAALVALITWLIALPLALLSLGVLSFIGLGLILLALYSGVEAFKRTREFLDRMGLTRIIGEEK